MLLPQKQNFYSPSNFALASAGCLGTTQKFALDRTWPLEEILLVVHGTVGTQLTLNATPQSPAAVDNLLGIVKRVNLSVNDGIQPRSVVDYSGSGLLEYCVNSGMNLDRATLGVVSASQGATVAASLQFRITYRIPLVNPMIGEPLRTRMLLPVHTYPQDPILTVDFESSATMYSAGTITALTCEVILIRRGMDSATNASILKSGGYIPSDLIESPFSIGTGTSGEVRFAVPTPGSYLNLHLRQYKGGANMSRDVIDAVTTINSESRWRIESGGTYFREWRAKHVQIMNDFTRVANHVTQTYSPNFAGAVAANTLYQPACSYMLDFLSDGVTGDSANELGSVLNCNLPAATGLKMEIIGSIASAATNGHTLFIGGQRIFGDVSQWQRI